MNVAYFSLPYVYPLCPLNFNHAKMFVVADVYARRARIESNSQTVIFPVASHFTGNTAQSTANLIDSYYKGIKNDETIATYNLYRQFYGVPASIIPFFADSDYLMRFFHQEILWELKSLYVSCDFQNAYTTKSEAFESFVRTIIRQYDREGLLTFNTNRDLAVNYDDPQWRDDTRLLIESTDIRKKFHRNNILSAFNTLSSGWELLRKTGYGVTYNDEGWIIDPMFDSELFMVYDLFNYWKNTYHAEIDDYDRFFEILFASLKDHQIMDSTCQNKEVIQGILDSLPCDVFFGEEHLKNWICKKFFAEQRLLHADLRTRSYRILGMGLLDGRRMSASAGHAVLAKNLIHEYGGQIARLIILLSGGNISNGYSFDPSLPEKAKKMLTNFSDYWVFLCSDHDLGENDIDTDIYVSDLERYIKEGYLCKAVTELLVNIPSKNKVPSPESKKKLLSFYHIYLPIFLPEFALCQMQ